jgi:hypothetical protein
MSPDSNGDLVVIFSGSLRFRHSGKMAITVKKGAGRNLPLSTKGGQNENHLDNTTKIYLVKQKTPESVP